MGTLKIINGGKDNRGKDVKISLVTAGETTTYIFGNSKILSNNKKTATLLTAQEYSPSDSDKKIISFNATNLNDDVNLIGNNKGNSLIGGAGNDTLYGGFGADIFIYDGQGADIITDYGVGSDKISLGAEMIISDVEVADKNVTLKFKRGNENSGSLKLENLKADQKVKIIETSLNKSGKEISKKSTYIFEDGKIFNHDKTSVTLTGSANNLSTSKTVRKISTGENFTGDKIIGNDRANTISGNDAGISLIGGKGNDQLYGGSGADTLWGGANSDTLCGGDGNDLFIYKPEEGIDTILDYQSGDMLQILKADGTNGSFRNALFSNNELKLSISGGGFVVLKNVTLATEFNINGTNYKISGSTLA